MANNFEHYAAMLPHIRVVAKKLGYALAVHGSMTSDLDLVAVPWTEEPESQEALYKALVSAFGMFGKPSSPVFLLHNRVAYGITLPDGLFLDLIIILREQDSPQYGEQ